MSESVECRAEGCVLEAVSRGLCHAHHARGMAWIRKDRQGRSWGSPGLAVAISGPVHPGPAGVPRRRAVGGPSVEKALCRAPSCGEPVAVRGLCRVHYSRGDNWIRGDRENRSWDSPEALRRAMGDRLPPGPLRGLPRLTETEADRAQEIEDRKAVERARAERAARGGP